jgi:hypothetical protein
MEPNKFENQLKKQLNEREIKPSEAAWDRLDSMLDVAEKKKRKFSWIAVAASFLGFLLIGTVYFSQRGNTIVVPKDEVVVHHSVAPKTTVVSANSIKLEAEHEKGLVAGVVQKSISGTNNILTLKEESIVVNNNSNQNQIAVVSIINQKTEQKSIKPQTSDLTVDELLAAVENSSKKESQINKNPSVHINVNTLLSQVDGELELSFREKVMNKVSKNYQTVRVALSNRNLE